MKLIRLLPILLVIGLSCLTSCQKEEIPSADNERTLFMYLPWSTNLTSYFYQNIDDMEDAISRSWRDFWRGWSPPSGILLSVPRKSGSGECVSTPSNSGVS